MSFHTEPQIQEIQKKSNTEDPSPEQLEADPESRDEDLCVICVKKRDGVHAFRPCGHAIACISCCIRLFDLNTSPMCPHCRKPIDSYLSVQLT